MTPDGETWSQMSAEEHQDYPGDFEAQGSQGPILLHSEEHLFGSDRGVVMLRKLTLGQIDAVMDGKDPASVALHEADALIRIGAGNYYLGEQ